MTLVQCANKFSCDNPEKPEPGDVYAPWVKLQIQNGNNKITVGNESFPTEHTAVIKSFEFGATDAFACSITIYDQRGGGFAEFMSQLIDTLDPSEVIKDRMLVSFGWVRILCDGSVQKTGTRCNGEFAEFIMHGMEIDVNFTDGGFIYTITGRDLGTYMIEAAKFEGNIGSDGMDEGGRDNRAPLTQAIRTLLVQNTETNSPPYVKEVKFLKDNGPNNEPDKILWNHRDGQTSYEGPKEVWRGNQRDKLNTIKGWTENYTAVVGADKHGPIEKTVKPIYNPCNQDVDEIVYWADKTPAPNEFPFTFRTVGCYYVNGGKESRVLEFNPKIKTNFGLLRMAGGNMPHGRAMDEDVSKTKPHPNTNTVVREDKNWKSAGAETSITPSPGLGDRNKKNATAEAGKGEAIQARGLSLNYLPLQADLVITGDPKYMPLTHLARNITIIFINPFHIIPNSTSNCGEWLAEPSCNNVLTNRGWFIQSINHKIQEGNFTTTLNLFLPTPEAYLDKGIPHGADPNGFNK